MNDNNKHAMCLSNVAILRAKARRELTIGMQNNILYINKAINGFAVNSFIFCDDIAF